MNVFEDLIEELKQENLLESTVIDGNSDDTAHSEPMTEMSAEISDAPSFGETTAFAEMEEPDDVRDDAVDNIDLSFSISDDDVNEPSVSADPVPVATAAQLLPKRPDREFFNKRALAEMSGLQMVDHVLTGVEREYLKVIPKPYDDFKAKIALNAFLQVADDASSEAHKTSEFNLIQETEAWCSALAERDKAISVSHLRQFCENARPALSSQAMLAIGKFYRNLPYSESVRSKFDFVITRLFSKPTDDDRRLHLFSRDETVDHIKRLYTEWASIPLYASDENDTDLTLAALSFEELTNEAENASRFDQLIENDFFGRLRAFKESINETFFAPTVISSAINANIKIGNRYVELLAKERELLDNDSIAARYSHIDAGDVSDAAARSLDLVGLMRDRSESDDYDEDDYDESDANSADSVIATPAKPSFIKNLLDRGFEVDRWVVIFAAVMIVASAGVYVWGNYLAGGEQVSTSKADEIELKDPTLREHTHVVKRSGDNMYVQTLPSWDAIKKETKQEMLGKYLAAAQEMNCEQVILLNRDGKLVAFVSPTRLDVHMP